MRVEQDDSLVTVFHLGEGCFGFPAEEIQEIVQPGHMTTIHRAPPFVCGIRNLRGRIVTVIDLKSLLGLGQTDPGPNTRVMIVGVRDELCGLLVESVEDAIFLDPATATAAPPSLGEMDGTLIRAIHPVGDRYLTLLDHAAVLRHIVTRTQDHLQ